MIGFLIILNSDWFQYKPMSARADLAAVEQTVADMRFFTEKEGQLSLNNYFMSP